jgi:hypothetical protein
MSPVLKIPSCIFPHSCSSWLNMNQVFTYLQCLWQCYSFRAWGPEKGPSCHSVSQSVRKSVKLLKKILSWLRTCHPSRKVATRKHVGNGPPTCVPTYHGLHAHQYSVVISFINLPSHYYFRRIDDKWEIIPTNQRSNWGRRLARSASRRSSVCIAIPAVTASLA